MAAVVDQQPGGHVRRARGRDRGVPGGDHLDPAPVEADGAAVVEADDVRDAVALDLGRQLDDREHLGAGALGDRDRVAEVVAVPVGERDHVGRHLVGGHGRLRVAGQERVDQHVRAASGEVEGGVAEPADVRSHQVSSLSMSSWASSKPTATPISIETRVSSASSSPHRLQALLDVGLAGRLEHLLLVGRVEPVRLVERLVEDPLQRGRVRLDDALGLREPSPGPTAPARRLRPRHRCIRGGKPQGTDDTSAPRARVSARAGGRRAARARCR